MLSEKDNSWCNPIPNLDLQVLELHSLIKISHNSDLNINIMPRPKRFLSGKHKIVNIIVQCWIVHFFHEQIITYYLSCCENGGCHALC